MESLFSCSNYNRMIGDSSGKVKKNFFILRFTQRNNVNEIDIIHEEDYLSSSFSGSLTNLKYSSRVQNYVLYILKII